MFPGASLLLQPIELGRILVISFVSASNPRKLTALDDRFSLTDLVHHLLLLRCFLQCDVPPPRQDPWSEIERCVLASKILGNMDWRLGGKLEGTA